MASEKQYKNGAKGLEEICFHATIPPLDKDAAWKKLQALRNNKTKPAGFYIPYRRVILSLGAIAAALLIYFILPVKPANAPILPETTTPLVTAPSLPKETVPTVTTIAESSFSTKKQVTVPAAQHKRSKKPINNAMVPEPAIIQKDSIIPESNAVAMLADTVQQRESMPALSMPSAPKRVFHINELKDPDRPYTVNQEKRKTTTPAARQEKSLSIKINLSN